MRKGTEVEVEEMIFNVRVFIPKELSGKRRLSIFRKFGPLHSKFCQIVKEECRKDGYVGIPDKEVKCPGRKSTRS